MGRNHGILTYPVARDHGLSAEAHQVLTFMALHADDRDARPVYFGSLAKIADATGCTKAAIRQRVRVLRDAGLIVIDNDPVPGTPARYLLLFADKGVSTAYPLDSDKGYATEAEGVSPVNARGMPHRRKGYAPDTPQSRQEVQEGEGPRFALTPPRFSEQEPKATAPHVPQSADSKNAEEGVTARTAPDASRVPQAVAAAVSPFCRNHPEGTDKPCRPCAIAYERWKESQQAKPQSATGPTPSLMVTVQPDSRCAPGTHELSGDPPGCSNCPVRPWELEEEGRGSTVRSTAAVAKPPKPPEHPEPSTLASVLARMP
jgi:hypothetical protein